MESLENIAFDRIYNFLIKFNVYIKFGTGYANKKGYTIVFNNKTIVMPLWKSKRAILFRDNNIIRYRDAPIFEISKCSYNCLHANFSMQPYEIALAKCWPTLQQFQADSLEEMMVKMDLAGI